jgi:uncharacterized protein
MDTLSPFSKPLYVMAKPAGARCNLRCSYCYYLEKTRLYPETAPHTMSDELLELFTRQYIEAQTQPEIVFTWHGGEPLLRPIGFYRKALAYQRAFARGRSISNCIQTNGTLLDDEWCRFFHDNGWLVGISIDGPQEYHDSYRRTADNRPTHSQVMRGIELLQKHQVEWNAMAVVHAVNADHPREFYQFFCETGCQYLQFAPIVERHAAHADGRRLASLTDREAPLTALSVRPDQWGDFLISLFDQWVRRDVGRVFVELFDCTLANWCGVAPGICIFARDCGHAGVMEYNGDVYSCDHFVFPEYKLGNIRSQTLTEMLYGPKQQQFSDLKHQSLPQQCLACRYEFACHGECPKNRFVPDRYGNPGLNYLCEGYHRFFEHVAPYMDFMRNEIIHQRPPTNVMRMADEIARTTKARKSQ